MARRSTTTDDRPFATKVEVDRFLQGLRDELSASALATMPSLIVSGPARCGKSRLAEEIAARYGHRILSTDWIRASLYPKSRWKDRRRVTKYVYKSLLLSFPTGIILEGDVFFSSKDRISDWAIRRGVPFIGIGYSFDRPQDKYEDLVAYHRQDRCWLVESRTDEELHDFAAQIVAWSRDFRARCEDRGASYFDLDSRAFATEIDRIATAVGGILRRRMAATRSGARAG